MTFRRNSNRFTALHSEGGSEAEDFYHETFPSVEEAYGDIPDDCSGRPITRLQEALHNERYAIMDDVIAEMRKKEEEDLMMEYQAKYDVQYISSPNIAPIRSTSCLRI